MLLSSCKCFEKLLISIVGGILPLGKMEINPLKDLLLLTKLRASRADDLPSLADLDTDAQSQDDKGDPLIIRDIFCA